MHPIYQFLERAVRIDLGGHKLKANTQTGKLSSNLAQHLMSSMESIQLFVPRHQTHKLMVTHTHLLTDFVAHRTLMGDLEIAHAASEGRMGLLQLFDRGTNDRKQLEILICATMRYLNYELYFYTRTHTHAHAYTHTRRHMNTHMPSEENTAHEESPISDP